MGGREERGREGGEERRPEPQATGPPREMPMRQWAAALNIPQPVRRPSRSNGTPTSRSCQWCADKCGEPHADRDDPGGKGGGRERDRERELGAGPSRGATDSKAACRRQPVKSGCRRCRRRDGGVWQKKEGWGRGERMQENAIEDPAQVRPRGAQPGHPRHWGRGLGRHDGNTG